LLLYPQRSFSKEILPMTTSQDIRRAFLRYFKEHGHAVVPSSPVIPFEDPTLLFTNAGMNQFKDVFLGKTQRDYTRAATSQKCIRAGGKHNDLDNVGHTSRHLTFFEMLGNFSFGDYFKEKAIEAAWEVTTEVFGFSPNDLWISVFENDDEAFELWQKYIPKNRLVRMGAKDNFWEMGETGPCGPCSELYFDRGPKYGNATSPKEDVTGERYLEFWNLVFMQFNKDSGGKLTPLPKQSIDTGSGLERVVSLKMGVDTIFATDIFRSLIAEIEHVSGKKYPAHDPHLAPAFHVIADHIRSLAFSIADGAQPSNVERGYVLRKILRRAVRYGRIIGLQEPFLAKVLPRLVSVMGADYPELVASQGRIAEIVTLEEEAFIRTLKRGGNILNSVIDQAQKSPLKQITGEDAFKLKDTYGLPLDEILLIAKDTGLQVNLDAYQMLEEQAKEKSRSAKQAISQEAQDSLFKDFVSKYGPCEFVGYTDTAAEASIVAIIIDGKFVEKMNEGEEGWIMLDKTPFYAEKGGQIGDQGTLSHHSAQFTVHDTQNPYPRVIVQSGKLEKGILLLGEPVSAVVDKQRRQEIANHHTATHLLHWALQKVLGEHIKQAGSLVTPDRLRFDFNHHKSLTPQEIREIENLVNDKVREDAAVTAYELSYDEAQKRSDIKQFFGEKYGSSVRVIDIDYSKELCGGTHTSHVGTIGLIRIVKESSIAAGVRRIEAVCGKAAEEWMREQESLSQTAANLLKTSIAQLPEKVAALIEENKTLALQLKTLRRAGVKQTADELLHKMQMVHHVPVLCAIVDLDMEDVLFLAETLAARAPSHIFVIATKGKDKCNLFIKVSADLVQKGFHAGQLIKEIAPSVGGTGGGKPESAQAGGKNPSGIEDAFAKLHTLIKK
jgi:alanyl-tRNA synthetase